MGVLVLSMMGGAAAASPSLIDVDASARAAGNDRADAIAIARALLQRTWAAQITQIRVDRVGSHRVAGVTLLGTKMHRRVDAATFFREANRVIDVALSAEPNVEEVDLRTTVPAPHRTQVGEMDEPLVMTVFTLTVRRGEGAARAAFWDPVWRAELDHVR